MRVLVNLLEARFDSKSIALREWVEANVPEDKWRSEFVTDGYRRRYIFTDWFWAIRFQSQWSKYAEFE